MALLQTLGPFTQPLAPAAQYPNPYTLGPFTQPLTEEILPPPPPPAVQGGGGLTQWCPPEECPPGTEWDPVCQQCVPICAELDLSTAKAMAAALGLALDGPKDYQVLAARMGLLIDWKTPEDA